MYSIYDEGLGRLLTTGRNSPTKEAAKDALLHYLSGSCSRVELAALSILTPDELAARHHYKIFKHLTPYPADKQYTPLFNPLIAFVLTCLVVGMVNRAGARDAK